MGYTKTSEAANLNRYQAVDDDASVIWLEKAQSGKVSLEDIQDALSEFSKLFKAGMASKAETLTLARAFPDSPTYTEAARKQSEKDDTDPIVIGGPASVSLVDREGHLITTQALERAFQKFMSNDRTRNVMVLHSDVQIGWALPAYISKGGQIFKSGVDDKGLFFICELRDDTSIAKKVADQIHKGMLKSYSIAGSATKIQNMTKGLVPYVQVDDMELAEVTVCEKGVNQGASFEILKAEMPPRAESPQIIVPIRKMTMYSHEDGTINFTKSFTEWLVKEKDPLTTKESFVTLNNEAGRQAEHAQLLREYGFPSAQPVESMRYVPVVETETDDDGIPVHNLPPWVVNEAGEALGDRLDEDSPGYKKSDKAKARQKAGSAQKMFMDFMEIKKAPGDERMTGLEPEFERRRTSREVADRNRERATEGAASSSGLNPDAQRTLDAEAKRKETERVGQERQPTDYDTPPKPTIAPSRRNKEDRSVASKQEIERKALHRNVGRGVKGAFAGGRESREQLGRTLGAAGKGIGRLFSGGKERAADISGRAAGGIASGVKGFGQEVGRGYRREAPRGRDEDFLRQQEHKQPEERKTMASRMGRLFRGTQEQAGKGTGQALRGGAAAGRMGLRGAKAGTRAGLRQAGEALGGAAEGYRSYDPSSQKFRSFPARPEEQGDFAFADKKPSVARRIGRMFGQTGRGTQEAVGAGVGAGARFGAGTAAGLAGTKGARGGGDPEAVGGKGRIGGAGYRLGRVGREFARGAMRGGTPSERLREGRDASRFGGGARGGRESTAERMGRYFGTVGRGGGREGVTAGKKTAQFIGEHAPKVGAGARRGRAERAAGAASLDAEHASIGIGGERTINHPAHHGKSYAESNNLVSSLRENQGPKSISDHLAIYQHMLSNHHGDHQGDKIVHTSLNLPEGMTHNSVIDNHAFVSMMHPEGGQAGYQPTADYKDNHQGVMDNVHKVLGQYAGGKIPPMMDTGAPQKPIQGLGGGASTPSAPSDFSIPKIGTAGKPDFSQPPPAAQKYRRGPSAPAGGMAGITNSIDKMLNKALRAKSRGYSKEWGGKRYVNR